MVGMYTKQKGQHHNTQDDIRFQNKMVSMKDQNKPGAN